ncbi:hypothetical protein VIBNIFTn2_120032 [Vibrio nigripulchritudo FTn2]|nr:hypothetical protein VIBNIFTn2_120032 [Vibrio nigripulchritudo FTn2]
MRYKDSFVSTLLNREQDQDQRVGNEDSVKNPNSFSSFLELI